MSDFSTPTTTPPSAPVTPPPQYNGVGGWLLFFCISITILSPLFALVNLSTGWNDSLLLFEYYPNFLTIMIVDTALSLCLVAFGIYAGTGLWRIRPAAVKMAKRYLLSGLIYQVFSSVLLFMVGFPTEVTQEIIPDAVKGIFQGSVYFVIWFTYLVKSKRVQNTYFLTE